MLPIALRPWDRLSLEQKWVPGAFPGGKGGRCVRLTTLPPSCAVVTKSGNLNFLEPSVTLQACNGTDLPSYNIDCNIQVVVEVFSIMAAYFVQSCCACVLRTVQNVWFPFETWVDNFIQHMSWDTQFLRAFAKLWKKAAISFVMSFRPSIRPHGTTRLPRDGVSWI